VWADGGLRIGQENHTPRAGRCRTRAGTAAPTGNAQSDESRVARRQGATRDDQCLSQHLGEKSTTADAQANYDKFDGEYVMLQSKADA
jgi:hypothetical protein